MGFFAELKRRNVIRVAVAYLVFSWLVLQVLDVVTPILDLPRGGTRTVFVLLAMGFVGALVFSWVYELTPEGLKRDSEIGPGASITHVTARKLDIAVIVLLVLSLGVFAFDRFSGGKQTGEPSTAAEGTKATPATASPATPSAPSVPTAPVDEPATKSIAVLPFVNMSPDPEQVYFSDGISEELLNGLVKLPGLKVAGRTSSFAFRDKTGDLREIGKALNVGHILEGSVRKQGMRIRITAQLVKADDGFHLWSETYDRDAGDIFALQDEITAAIIDALKVQLGSVTAPVAAETGLEAYNLYLQARQKLAARGVENLLQARSLFEQAIALDPTYAPAQAGLARATTLVYMYAIDLGKDQRVSREQAAKAGRAAANAALALDPDNAEAWSVLGFIGYLLESDVKAAGEAIARSVALRPNDSEILNFAGDFYFWTMDPRAVPTERLAAELDPLRSFNHHDVAQALVATGDLEGALRAAAEAERLGFYKIAPTARGQSSIPALVKLRRFDEAKRLIASIESDPLVTPAYTLSMRTFIAQAAGETAAANAMLEQLLPRARAGETQKSTMALLLVNAGRNDEAAEMLEQAFAEGDFWIVDPTLRPLPERLPEHAGLRALYNQPELVPLFELRRRNLASAAEPKP